MTIIKLWASATVRSSECYLYGTAVNCHFVNIFDFWSIQWYAMLQSLMFIGLSVKVLRLVTVVTSTDCLQQLVNPEILRHFSLVIEVWNQSLTWQG